MTEYLSKEEIRQWRSSVEKITLEEYAARLGKSIEEKKETRDLVDIIYEGGDVVQNYNYSEEDRKISTYQRPESISTLPKPEKIEFMKPKVESVTKPKVIEKTVEINKPSMPKQQAEPIVKVEKQKLEPKATPIIEPEKVVEAPKVQPKEEPKTTPIVASSASGEIQITFKKNLTDREEKVLEHFKRNRGKIVYAKELADLLNLKRDYIYKYIKNLRSKIVEDVLENADKGGFLLR